MSGLIKKQILKHLSKFAKNLSADSIQLSTLRGEAELFNLELDCVAIQNLVNLPTWLQINHAKCNRVHVKFLDSVELDMVTCEKPREPNGQSPIEASASGGDSSFGFTQKVLEGMAVRINSINVNFSSAVFKAEFQLSQLLVYSTDPDGKKADLRFTRIMNKAWGQVLTFKKISWQTMRIVTDAATVRTGGATTPIRLITNQAVVRIIMRRKISDLSVLAAQLWVQFDDLLWVLTDAQVQSAMLCVKSIRETIERSQQQGRSQSSDKPQTNQTISPPVTPSADDATPTTPCDPYFMRHIIHETSYHCDIDRIDLHICDDGSNANTEATYKKVIEGGAILITFYNLKVDHYPSHKGGKSRNHFRDYNDIAACRDKWAEEIIVKFRKDFVDLKKGATAAGYVGPKTSAKLLESCLLLRLGDIEVGQVSSATDKERHNNKVLSSNRKELFLPDDMPLATVIITDYFFPDGRDYPSPHSNIFVRATAPNIRAHWPSLLWINQLALSTMKSVQRMLEDLGVAVGGGDPMEEEHTDIRVETLMPKIFLPSAKETDDPDLPEGIEIQVSQAAATNCRYGQNSSRKYLSKVLNDIKKTFISSNNTEFPCDVGHDYDILHQSLDHHAAGEDTPIARALREDKPQLKASSLKDRAYKDVWSVWIRQVWLDFVMKDATGNPPQARKSIPFIDSIPLSMWITKTDICFQPPPPIKVALRPHKTESLPTTPSCSEVDVIPMSRSDHVIAASSTSMDGDHQEEEEETTTIRSERPRRNQTLLNFYRHTLEEEKKLESSKPVKTIEGPAGTYLLVSSEKPVRVMLDHHQFLYLLRLAESIQSVGEKAYSDTNTILSNTSTNPDTSAVASSDDTAESDAAAVRLALPSVDLFLVLRPTTDAQSPVTNPTNHAPPSPTSRAPVVPRFPSPTPFSSSSDSLRSVTPASSECSSLDTISILGEDVSSFALFSSPTYNLDSDAPSSGKSDRPYLPSSPTHATTRRRGMTDPAETLRKKTEFRLNTKLTELSSPIASSVSLENVSNRSVTVSSSGYLTDSTDSMVTMATRQDEDCQSIASSGTSSLDQFVFLDIESLNGADGTERRKASTADRSSVTGSLQSEILSPTRTSPSPRGMTDSQATMVDGSENASMRGVEEPALCNDTMVSLLRISATNGVPLCVDSHGNSSSIRIVAHDVDLSEFGNMTRDDATNMFSRSTSIDTDRSQNGHPSLRMRIDSGDCATRFYPTMDTHMGIRVQGINEKLMASTLSNIGAFLEDDVAPEVLPMTIEARDVTLTIEDDGDPVYPTTVKSPPVMLKVDSVGVRCDDAGVFHVTAQSTGSSPSKLLTSLHNSPNHNKAPPTSSTNDITTQTLSHHDTSHHVEKCNDYVTDNMSAGHPLIETSPSDATVNKHELKFSHDVTNDVMVVDDTDSQLANVTTDAAPTHRPSSQSKEELVVNGDITSHVSSMEKRLKEITEERDCLLTALRHMQEELMMSENEKSDLRMKLKEQT